MTNMASDSAASPPPPPPPSQTSGGVTLPLLARASKTVRNKNLLIILMCAVFTVWFAYDGWVRYPAGNDRLIAGPMQNFAKQDPRYADALPVIQGWPGWTNAPEKSRTEMSDLANELKVEGWHSETDIANQRYIVLGLGMATVTAIWWFVHCQKRRVIADEQTVSPSPGVVIPWEAITVVDNTRWKSMGIVTVTYEEGGLAKTAKFDDYETEREALLGILDMLAEKAARAEFLPKEEAA